jgi:hypothetical protein
MSASTARLKHFGWGREGEGLTPEEEAFAMSGTLAGSPPETRRPIRGRLRGHA